MSKVAVSAMAITAITPACTGSETTRSACVGHAAGHVQRDHEQALSSDFGDRVRDLAAHQRAGQHEQPHARQPDDRADGAGERVFADERDRVDRDVLAADVVAIGFGDRADRHLADLRAAAHDDDALAVDLVERRRQFDARDAVHLAQLRGHRVHFGVR